MINDIEANLECNRGQRDAQKVLAREVTHLVHGEAGLAAAQRITDALFRGRLESLSQSDWEQLKLDGIPFQALTTRERANHSLPMLLTESGLVQSGKQVKDALQRQAVLINGRPLSHNDGLNAASCFETASAVHGRFYLVKLGKKKFQLFERV